MGENSQRRQTASQEGERVESEAPNPASQLHELIAATHLRNSNCVCRPGNRPTIRARSKGTHKATRTTRWQQVTARV